MPWLHDIATELARNLPIAFASLLSAFATDILHRLARWRRKRHKQLRSFAVGVEEDQQIRSWFDEARNALGAIDIYVGALHNGGELMNGKSLLRISRMYERPRPGTTGQAEQFVGDVIRRRDIVGQAEQFTGDFVSSLPGEMELMLEDGSSFTLVEKLPAGKLRWVLESGGRKAIARRIMKRGNEPMGYVGIDFDTIEPPENLDAIMSNLAYRVGQIFMRY